MTRDQIDQALDMLKTSARALDNAIDALAKPQMDVDEVGLHLGAAMDILDLVEQMIYPDEAFAVPPNMVAHMSDGNRTVH